MPDYRRPEGPNRRPPYQRPPGGGEGGRGGLGGHRPQRQGPPPEDIIYGTHAVLEALAAGRHLDKVLLLQGADGRHTIELRAKLKEAGVGTQFVPAEKLDQLARGGTHQGVVAFVAAVAYQTIAEVLARVFEAGQVPLLLLLDGVTDVRNIGAIARSAECMGAHALLIPQEGSARLGADAVKTSAGALHHLPVCRVATAKHAVAELQASGVQVLAVTEKAEAAPSAVALTGPVCLLLGDEGEGIAPGILRLCDAQVRIPMRGQVQSLNVSVAAGMLLYEADRQRGS